MSIAREHILALSEHGFTSLDDVFSSERVSLIREHLDRHATEHATPGPYGLICHNPWPHLDILARTIEQVLAPLVLDALGADEVVLFQDVLIAKPPGTPAVQWHQDYSYWPLDRADGITLWIALDDADEHNGCLRYAPGGHRDGERQPADFFIGATQAPRPGLLPLDIPACEQQAVSVRARAGAVLMHHPLVVHMSLPNRSERERHAWSLTFLGTNVKWDTGHAPHPFAHELNPTEGTHVRGELFPRYRSR